MYIVGLQLSPISARFLVDIAVEYFFLRETRLISVITLLFNEAQNSAEGGQKGAGTMTDTWLTVGFEPHTAFAAN